MPDYAALAAELARPELAGLDAAAAADFLNAETVPGPRRRVTVGELRYWGAASGVLPVVLDLADATDHPLRGIALALRLVLHNDPGVAIDLDDPQTQEMLAALRQHGIIPSDEAIPPSNAYASLLALADGEPRPAILDTFGVHPVSALDVHAARNPPPQGD